MINKKVARRYSTALYQVASETKATARIKKDLAYLKKLIESSRDLKLFLATPIIIPDKKVKILELLVSKKVSKLMMKFLIMLTEKNRERFLYDICQDYNDLLNETNGIAEANIRTTIKLKDKEKKQLSDKLKAYTGKNIDASYTLDPSLKGGFVAQIDDTIIDASIARQLDLLYLQLKEGRFNEI
jgi:F-type H+-transporting ATPase subunit delta